MAHVNVPQGRRWPGKPRWGVLDVVSAALFTAVFVLLVLIVALLDSPTASPFAIDSCPAEEVDNMPCEDPRRNSQLSREMNFYRDRHCPLPGETPLCLVPPAQRVPDSGSVAGEPPQERKGHQGWMKEEGPYFIFPSGGTMFPDGAINYIKKLGQFIPLNKGLVRTALDMGCMVASFGGFLLKEDIMTFSFAPRDSHKSQIQFALERGIPAFVAMLGTRRLPFPASSFDLVHCSRCLIPFTVHKGYLVISGPPVQWTNQDKEWADLQAMVHALCYKLITVDGNTAIWKKPSGASCLPNLNNFRLDRCSDNDDPNEAWYFKLRKCITKVPLSEEISIGAIPEWPQRLPKTPARVSLMKNGIDTFDADT
ncbi:hypothetical protein C4D60_Mb11t03000 [Musa balbisiana]|uniref:Methyltransferase n=1 Tax=Musa balbisiana TaxID=52838 RepID=A0A4S8J259_MUSBA|nr:hypothetical protein C4D60_Mb11t03000 [Musa balbisiana]